MNVNGVPLDTSLAQVAHAQIAAAKGRDRERAASEAPRRDGDADARRVAGVEDVAAIRGAENDDLEDDHGRSAKHRAARDHAHPDAERERRDDDPPSVDLTA